MTRRIILAAIWPLLFLLPVTVMAAPDSYIGDAAIYSALAGSSTRPKPHVLFLIDTSRATLNQASGVPYYIDSDPDTDGIQPYPDAGYEPWSIYAFKSSNGTWTLAFPNDTDDLENLTCANNDSVIKNTLLASGTYSGSGSTDYPNLKAGTGSSKDLAVCDTGPNGATYALGNYLNYTHASGTSETVVKKTYTCGISKNGNSNPKTVTDGCVATYIPIADSTGIEPGSAADGGIGT